MKRKLILYSLLLSTVQLAAQFDPPAGQPGSQALHADSSIFVAWATGATIIRGYKNIAVPTSGYASYGDSTMVTGKANGIQVASLGDGGSAIVTFNKPIRNDAGYDFAVFENGFDDVFLELAFVEVSSDGINFFRLPATSNTPDSVQTGSFASTDARKLHNLAGKYRALYGTPFDLDDVAGIEALNVERITHVKIVDVVGCIQPQYATIDKNGRKVNDPWPTDFASGGFDLDAVGVIHQAISDNLDELASKPQLQVYPNPLLSEGTIKVQLTEPQIISVDIIDMTGRLLTTLVNKQPVAGEINVPITTSVFNKGKGMYAIRIVTEKDVITKKIMLLND